MENSLIKPDVMLVTKNVMVPLALPASDTKFFPNPLSSRKKTKIVKSRKCKTLPKSEDICRHRRDKSNEKTTCNSVCSNCNSLIHFGEENSKYLYSQEVTIKETRVKKFKEELSKSKSCLSDRRQNLMSESFPMTIEREKEHRKTNVITKKKEDFVLEKSKENYVERVGDENEEPEVLSYRIKRRPRKISLPKSSVSLTYDRKDDKMEDRIENKIEDRIDNKIEEKKIVASLEKSIENVAQFLPDEIEVINQIKLESSAISIPELHPCISDSVCIKPDDSVEKEESKSTEDDKCEIKYSWQDLDNWVPPSQKRKIVRSAKNLENSRSDCRIKYSWQVIGTGAQTSDYLLENFSPNGQIRRNEIAAKNYPCSVKYSWQIIGTATQVSFSNSGKDQLENDEKYWEGKILTPATRTPNYDALKNDSKKITKRKILYNEATQTFAEKSHQTDLTDCRAKYSWQNLTKNYLASDKLP